MPCVERARSGGFGADRSRLGLGLRPEWSSGELWADWHRAGTAGVQGPDRSRCPTLPGACSIAPLAGARSARITLGSRPTSSTLADEKACRLPPPQHDGARSVLLLRSLALAVSNCSLATMRCLRCPASDKPSEHEARVRWSPGRGRVCHRSDRSHVAERAPRRRR